MNILVNSVKSRDTSGELFGRSHNTIMDAKYSVMETFSAMIADPQFDYEGSNKEDLMPAIYGILEMKNTLSQYEQKFMNLMSVK